MHSPVAVLVRFPLSLLTRLRLALFGHEELAGIVFWAALIGVCGSLASVAFREGVRRLEMLFTGQSKSLVQAASSLAWWHRALVPIVGGALAGFVLHLTGRALRSSRAVDYTEAVLVGDGRIGFRATLAKSLSSLLRISSGGSIGREGPMVQLVAWLDPGEVLAKLTEHLLQGGAAVASVASPVAFRLTPEMPLSTALRGFLREQMTVLPVTPVK